MPSLPHVLVLDNSPRQLAGRWFPRWLKGRLGCPVSVYHVWGGSRVKSLEAFDALVVSGSPSSATEDEAWILHELDLLADADRRGMPVMGVCFGSQLLARAFYGKGAIRRSEHPEFGWHLVELAGEADDPLVRGVPRRFTTFHYHLEEVVPQQGMRVLARNDNTSVQTYRVGDRPIWGVQFHLEVTPQAGRDLLRRTKQVYEPLGFTYEEMVARARPNEASERLFQNFVGAWQDQVS